MTNTIFFGTPDFVIPIGDALLEIAEVKLVGVVTAPDKPVGRKQIITPSPVKQWAQNHNIQVANSKDLKSELGVLAAYGQIIPQEIIDLFQKGILVVHPSLLPKYRGASPVQCAILNGDKITGCSIIKMDAEMDHGPIVFQFEEEIKPLDTSLDLYNRIFTKTAEVLKTVIPDYLSGKIVPQEQNENKATYCQVLTKQDGFFEIENPPTKEILERMIRAYFPWPGVWTLYQGKRLKFLPDNKVQLEGKNPVSFPEFLKNHPEIQKLINF